MDGHRAMLDFLAEKAGYARAGHHGGGAADVGRRARLDDRAVPAARLPRARPAAARARPDANKVVCADGKVRALDFSLILQWRDAAGAYADRLVEAYVWQEAGGAWERAADGTSRQIAGVDADATNLFSKRTAAITPALAGAGRPVPGGDRAGADQPGAGRAGGAGVATLTRAAKVFGGETRDGQLARWAAEYDAAFGADVATLARQALGQAPAEAERWSERDVVTRALAEMEDTRQSWTRSNLMMAVSNALPGHLGIGPEQVEPLLEGLTDKAQALARHLNPRTGPQGLDAQYYRADGESVFVKPHSQRFATPSRSSARRSCARPRSAAAPRPGRPRTPTRSSPGSPAAGGR